MSLADVSAMRNSAFEPHRVGDAREIGARSDALPDFDGNLLEYTGKSRSDLQ